MSDSLLDPAELEAIQAAIRETVPRGRRSAATPDVEATRLALISDDRIAEAARPVLINLANRWTRPLTRMLKAHLVGNWQIDPMSAEVIDGGIAREELRGGWVGAISGPAGEIVMAVHGSVIDTAAAKRCGATQPAADPNRAPSTVSLRLFQPAGRAVLESFDGAWREVFETSLTPSPDLAIVSRLIESRSVLRIALMFSGDVAGRIQVYVRPEMLTPPRAALAAVKATAARIGNVLSNVPVEVVAELGTLRLSLKKIRSLERGATFTLQGFVDSRVPIYCEGVLKAWARPVVYRGVLAVRIESVVHGQGAKT